MDINQEKDNEFDKALRPLRFTDFIGQESIISNLKLLKSKYFLDFKSNSLDLILKVNGLINGISISFSKQLILIVLSLKQIKL